MLLGGVRDAFRDWRALGVLRIACVGHDVRTKLSPGHFARDDVRSVSR